MASPSRTISQLLGCYDVVKKFSDKQYNAPLPILALVEFITSENSLKKDEVIRKWFPYHSMEMVIPIFRKDGYQLDPHYHSIEGASIFYVDWALHFGKELIIALPNL